MKRMGVSAALAGALLLGPSAASAANKEQQQLMAELRMLQQNQQQLQVLVLSLAEALKTVNGRLDEQTAASRKAMADQRLLVEGMTDNVRILRERADDTNVRLASIAQELEAVRQTMAAQPQAVFPPAPGDPAADPAGGTVQPGSGTGATAPPVVPPNVSPQRTYDSAFSDYAAGQYELAIEGFETFLRLFPRNINSDEAQLTIGNAYYNGGKFQEAIAAFQRVVSDYPGTDSVPAALYKIGLTYNQMKQPDPARKALQVVLEEHPNSREAVLAKQLLDRLPPQ